MQNITKLIDHTVLKPTVQQKDIMKLTEEAKQYGFASVCVNPYWVPLAAKQLQGSEVKVCTVVGFPLGASAKEVKAFETKTAIAQGAQEIDMVINIGALIDGKDDEVEADIRAVVEAANGTLTKVIIETCLLNDEQKERACALSVKAGADFVKTSTGFSTGGATKEDVALMRKTVGPDIGVKASGGVRSLEDATAMVEAGATRLGASSGVSIAKGETSTEKY
ncbi:deoxyribose-phosphate aldolase [Longirhabdus pacifica]|uniref:deoxyribose-phosphate aldolase n=1 Tax=Longirhabdus pacifica TaxID=2305227 RepID=UPI001008BC64|nr:deoxyribose-phosphate aldolase [Longirhabdus pacifica]